jgi:hypothetical protein
VEQSQEVVDDVSFWKSKKGADNGIDTRVIMNIFIFLGAFIFFAGMYYSSLPQSTINSTGIQKPPELNTSQTNQSVWDFVNYAKDSTYYLSSTNPLMTAVIVIPIIVVIAFISLKLLKPFG